MNTRSFRRGRVAALGSGLAAAPAAAGPRNVLMQRSPLAGFQYDAAEELRLQLAVGQPLALARESDNPHDERAVRTDWHGRKLGDPSRGKRGGGANARSWGTIARADRVATDLVGSVAAGGLWRMHIKSSVGRIFPRPRILISPKEDWPCQHEVSDYLDVGVL